LLDKDRRRDIVIGGKRAFPSYTGRSAGAADFHD
jgi:hypothetical protein